MAALLIATQVGAGGSASDRYAVDARRVVFKSHEVACIVLFKQWLTVCCRLRLSLELHRVLFHGSNLYTLTTQRSDVDNYDQRLADDLQNTLQVMQHSTSISVCVVHTLHWSKFHWSLLRYLLVVRSSLMSSACCWLIVAD